MSYRTSSKSDFWFWVAMLTLLYILSGANAKADCYEWSMQLDAEHPDGSFTQTIGTATDHLPTRFTEWFVLNGQVVAINAYAMHVGNFNQPPAPCSSIVIYNADMVFKDQLGDLSRFDPTQGAQQ